MRSGNGPLAFKLMGSSPVKQMRDPTTPKNVENKDEKVSSSNQVKKPGIDTQLVEYVRRKIDERKNKNEIKIEEKNQAKLKSSNNSTEKGTETPKLQEDKTHVIKLDQTIGANQPRKEGYVTEELGPTSDNSGDQSEVKEKEKKKGWKFDIDWDEVGTEAIKAGVEMGIAALSAGTKKPPRRSGSIGSFAAHKFGTNTDITKS